MPYSYNTVETDGISDLVEVPFPYLLRTHVSVRHNGVVVPDTDYTWLDDDTIKLNSVPAAGLAQTVKRSTPVDEVAVVFSAGNLSSRNLNIAELQSLYIDQELADALFDEILRNDRAVRVKEGTIDPIDVPLFEQKAIGIKDGQFFPLLPRDAGYGVTSEDILDATPYGKSILTGTGTPISGLLGAGAVGLELLAAATEAEAHDALNMPASAIHYDNSTSGLDATAVQAALDELAARPPSGSAQVIHLKDYATPGGLVDAAAGLAAAIAAIGPGGIIDGEGYTYRLDSRANLKSDLEVRNMVLDFSNAPKAEMAFRILGSEGAAVAITGGATRYSRSITVADATGLVPGMYIRIRSSDAYENNTNAAEGEFARILTVSGTTVTFREGLHANYTTSPVFYKPTFVENVTLRNIRAKGGGVLQNGAPSSDHYFLRCKSGFNIRVLDCSMDLFDMDNCEFDRSYKFWVHRSSMTRTYDSGAVGTLGGESYGTSAVHGSMYGYFLNNYYEDMRHAVMTGGIEGVVRYIFANGNQMVGCRAAAMDTHPAADMIHFCNNTISSSIGNVTSSSKNGIQHFGGTAVICNNMIRGSFDHGIACQIWAKNRPVSLTITGNQFEQGGGAGAMVYIECSNTPGRLDSVVISGNAGRANFGKGVYVNAVTSDIYYLSIVGNSFGEVTAGGHLVHIRGASGRLIEMFSVTGNTGRAGAAGTGVFLESNTGTIQRGAITGNSFYGGAYGVLGSAAGVDKITVVGNIFAAPSTAGTANLGGSSVTANNIIT